MLIETSIAIQIKINKTMETAKAFSEKNEESIIRGQKLVGQIEFDINGKYYMTNTEKTLKIINNLMDLVKEENLKPEDLNITQEALDDLPRRVYLSACRVWLTIVREKNLEKIENIVANIHNMKILVKNMRLAKTTPEALEITEPEILAGIKDLEDFEVSDPKFAKQILGNMSEK